MVMAVALIVMVAASLVFHIASPWWITPLASNWQRMDDTLDITLLITGIFFVGINLFVAFALWRYRHSDGRRAAYEPDNRKLERRLLVGTTFGIMALLAPGLFVYADYVRPPDDALVVEVLGKQWEWHFRFPGASGKLGLTNVSHVNASNPFGLDPKDPVGQDNLLVTGDLHLPLNKPVKVLLRSQDVLHDFYVPQFRARMNIVPGMVTSFWFTPTKAGRYEILCAQLCGVGHYNMRGYVVVEDEATFLKWLEGQPTFTATMDKARVASAAGAGGGNSLPARGQALAQSKGCIACHSTDGKPGVGPTWKGLFGKMETMADGSSVQVDDAFLKNEIRDPKARVVKGFAAIMPTVELTDDEVAAVTAYIQSLGNPGQPPANRQ